MFYNYVKLFKVSEIYQKMCKYKNTNILVILSIEVKPTYIEMTHDEWNNTINGQIF